jgi:ribulose-5-phosphate 4-epimerase/fuculose-1-phosphate aldolase
MDRKEELDSFVYLSRFFGAFPQLTQGAGGNISVKTDDTIFIKSSGVFLNEVSTTHGYVECDLYQLHSKKYKDIEETIKTGNGKPSMELGFHLLPSKYIVHVHPSFLLPLLCKPVKNIEESVFQYDLHFMIVPYKQPGNELSEYIRYHYANQKILLLQNHGIILLGNTIQEIFKHLDSVLGLATESSPIPIPEIYESTCHTFYKILEHTGLYAQYITSISEKLPERFTPITPDFFLFLKEYPYFCSQYEPDTLQHYKETYGFFPSILQIDSLVFSVATSWKQIYALKDLFLSWYPVCREKLTYIPLEEAYELYQNKQEQYRLGLKETAHP